MPIFVAVFLCGLLLQGVDSQYTVTIVSSPAGTPVSGSTNTFDYPILSSVTLTCMVNPIPSSSVTYQWNTAGCYTNAQFTYSNPECFPYGETTQSVTGNNLNAEDAGTITCTVTISGSDYTSGPFTLRISGVAVTRNSLTDATDFLTEYSYVYASDSPGNGFVLARCLTGLGPTGTTNDANGDLGGWYFINGTMIPNSGVNYECSRHSVGAIQARPGVNTAGVSNIRQCDPFTIALEGIYTCTMMNSSMMNQSVRLGVYFTGRSAPVIDTPSSSTVTVNVSDPVTLSCTSRGSPPDTFTWRKDNDLTVLQSTSITAVDHTDTRAVFRADYSIDSVTISDRGTYTCTVTNPIGSDSTTITVIERIDITQQPADVTITLLNNYTNVSLTCEANGASSYKWERQNAIIPSDSTGVNTNTLTLINLQPKDAGNYRCVATNAGGSSESNYATVTISSFARVVTHPTDTSAAAPFGAIFSCTVEAYGYLTVTWYRNNRNPVPKKAYSTLLPSVTVTTSILTIPNVISKDVGTYYCVVQANRKTAQSLAVNLILAGPFSPPVVTTDPVVNLTINNYNLTMKCLPDNSKFNYKWIKKNETLPLRAQGANTSQLTIVNLKPEDSGDYQCVMTNSTGTISSNFSTVDIIVSPPLIIKQLTDEVAELYSFIIFECKVQGYGYINVEWRKLGSPLPNTAVVNNINLTNGVSSILKITKVIGHYDGMYCCVVNNVAGQTTSKYAKLSVKVLCPEIIKPYQNITVPVNKAADLYCLASSCGGLTYDWTKNASSLPASAVTSYVSKKFLYFDPIFLTYQLTVPNVQLSDEGWYCCLVTNECGTTEKCVWLEVKTMPTIIKHPVSMAFRENSEQVSTLSCLASGLVPLNYHWQMYQSTNDSWTKPSVRAVNITSPKLVFSKLTEEDEGIYRCIVFSDDDKVISDNATITLYGPPEITYISPDMTYLEGTKASLVCNATNDVDAVNEVQIAWFFKNSTSLYQIVSNNRIIYYVENSTSGQLYSILLFDPINRTDEGVYICRASNHPQSSTESSTEVKIERVCPVLQDPTNGKVFVQGNTAFFVCFPGTVVTGNPILTCNNGNWNGSPPTCKLLNQ